MIPSDAAKDNLELMYEEDRVTAILNQFKSAEGTIGIETILGEMNNQTLESGYYLEISETGYPLRSVHLPIGEHLIGRCEPCKILLHPRYISRVHCMITVHADGHIALRDLKSTNHVYVNKVQMESEGRCELEDGAIISVSNLCTMTLTKRV